MHRLILTTYLFLVSFGGFAQEDHGFPYGQISVPDLQMKSYAKDSTANTLVLDEFGESWIDN